MNHRMTEYFVDVSDSVCRPVEEDPTSAEKRKLLFEKLNSIDPEKAREDCLKRQRIRFPSCGDTTRRSTKRKCSSSWARNRDTLFHFCSSLLQVFLSNPEVSEEFGSSSSQILESDATPEYLEVIDSPADLSSISAKLEAGKYCSLKGSTNVNAFAGDVRSVFQNALQDNKAGTRTHYLARDMLSRFEETLCEFPTVEEDIDDEVAPDENVSTKRTRRQKDSATQNGKFVPMTYLEKKKLGEDICRLPDHKLTELVRFIAVREGPAKLNAQDEIELDIDNMGVCTLRDIEQFLIECHALISEDEVGKNARFVEHSTQTHDVCRRLSSFEDIGSEFSSTDSAL
mmetsp:Transcript_6460/g.11504  ORF Transcript_6460/g.11504 Transcript_6460/m.11504 type:complete len:342 (-) Transcript_6460:1232-2257(-)